MSELHRFVTPVLEVGKHLFWDIDVLWEELQIGLEKALAAASYAGLEDHKKEHAALVKQVLEVQAKYKAGATALLSMEVMNFLKNWLIKHIQGTDKKYTPVLAKAGVVV